MPDLEVLDLSPAVLLASGIPGELRGAIQRARGCVEPVEKSERSTRGDGDYRFAPAERRVDAALVALDAAGVLFVRVASRIDPGARVPILSSWFSLTHLATGESAYFRRDWMIDSAHGAAGAHTQSLAAFLVELVQLEEVDMSGWRPVTAPGVVLPSAPGDTPPGRYGRPPAHLTERATIAVVERRERVSGRDWLRLKLDELLPDCNGRPPRVWWVSLFPGSDEELDRMAGAEGEVVRFTTRRGGDRTRSRVVSWYELEEGGADASG